MLPLSILIFTMLHLQNCVLCDKSCDRSNVSGTEGGDVTLQVDRSGITSIHWNYLPKGTLIVTTKPGKPIADNDVAERYRGRVTSTDNGSLHITGLTQEDEGIYTADIQTDGGQMCLQFHVTLYRYDCSDIWERNKASASGTYSIQPEGAQEAFLVYCEMTAAGGWTVIQKHNGEDGLSFNKMWADYEGGFGKPTGEHWLGLKQIHLLTNQKRRPCALRISLGDFSGADAYAEYRPFSIGDHRDFYRLSLGQYSGTAGDAFLGYPELDWSNQYGSSFSTEDNPNDGCHPRCLVGDIMYPSCSFQEQSGWWFNACGRANLNGEWHSPPDIILWASSVSWGTWKRAESLKYSVMYLIHQ